MKKMNHKGFTVVEAILVVVIMGIIGGVGYFVYGSQQKAKTSLDNAAKSQTDPQQSSNKTTKSYDGWKKYCDASVPFCFMHPASWTELKSATGMPATLVSSTPTAADTVALRTGLQLKTCANVAHPDNNTSTFTVTSIDPVDKADLKLKVLGGYSTDSRDGLHKEFYFEPTYILINESLVKEFDLKVGNTSSYSKHLFYEICFDFGDKSGYATAEPALTPSTKTSEEAEAWLRSAEAKTSRQILKSIQ